MECKCDGQQQSEPSLPTASSLSTAQLRISGLRSQVRRLSATVLKVIKLHGICVISQTLSVKKIFWSTEWTETVFEKLFYHLWFSLSLENWWNGRRKRILWRNRRMIRRKYFSITKIDFTSDFHRFSLFFDWRKEKSH